MNLKSLFGGWLMLFALTASGMEPDCTVQARRELELNLSSGVYTERAQVSAPLKIKLPAGTDATLHAECLRQRGQDPSQGFVRAVKRDSQCRRAARTTRFTNGATMHLASAVDSVAYGNCALYDIEVEVLLPAAAVR